jgi:outer membrane protein assembly factor BamD (BamD/ComL family)
MRPATIFECVAPSRAADLGRKASVVAYGKGRTNLLSRNWQAAIADFEEAVAQDPSDAPAKVMLDRARMLAQQPPDSNWDGVCQSPAKTAATG